MTEDLGPYLLISKTPEDPEERQEWARQMVRIQIAMWIDEKAECEMCSHRYESVDDFIIKHVKFGGPGKFVCEACWPLYEQVLDIEHEN